MADKPTTKLVASRIQGGLQSGSGGVSFDPTILITILTTIMALFKNCPLPQTGKDVHDRCNNVAKNTGLWHRLDARRFRRIVENNAPEEQVDEIEAAFLDSADQISVTEYGQMVAEA